MSESMVSLSAAFALGVLAAGAYLWALWIQVQGLARSRRGGFWLLAGAGVRIGLLLVVFALTAGDSWERLAACALGFLVVRICATRRVAVRPAPVSGPATGAEDRCR